MHREVSKLDIPPKDGEIWGGEVPPSGRDLGWEKSLPSGEGIREGRLFPMSFADDLWPRFIDAPCWSNVG